MSQFYFGNPYSNFGQQNSSCKQTNTINQFAIVIGGLPSTVFQDKTKQVEVQRERPTQAQNTGANSQSNHDFQQNLTQIRAESQEQSSIVNVWVENFEEELKKISDLLDDYPYIAMDTEFPGVVVDEMPDSYRTSENREYFRIKANVDILKIIQIGITLSDEDGKVPEPVSTWQFNFNFDIDNDSKAQNSINLLQSCGIDFQKLKRNGISPLYFAEKVTQSGLVLNDKIHWICFHGCYDFAYFLRIMMNEALPTNRNDFNRFLRLFFPHIYDIKSFQHELNDLFEQGGLNRLADILDVERVGITHQAGSDSLVTSQVFFKLKKNFATTIAKVLRDYNLDVFGFSNDQAYSSMIRGPVSFHIADHVPANQATLHNQEESSPLNTEGNFYQYGGGSNEYDYYNQYSNSSSNHLDTNPYQQRVLQNQNIGGYLGGMNQYQDSGKNYSQAQQSRKDKFNTNQSHLLSAATPPPMMIDGPYFRSLTPNNNGGESHQQVPQWNQSSFYSNANHQNGYPNNYYQ